MAAAAAVNYRYYPSETHRVNHHNWNVRFWDDHIETTVTVSASIVDGWISKTLRIHRNKHDQLLVGLDMEWCLPTGKTKTEEHQKVAATKTNEHQTAAVVKLRVGKVEWSLPTETETIDKEHQKVAIIQLCVGHRCLIFQLLHKDRMPENLVKLLGNKSITFVGKEIEKKAMKLKEDHELEVANFMDVSAMAEKTYEEEKYKRMSLRQLVRDILDVGLRKPEDIVWSKWDEKKLSKRQIEFACIDAFVCFQLGVELKKPLQNSHVDESASTTTSTTINSSTHSGSINTQNENGHESNVDDEGFTMVASKKKRSSNKKRLPPMPQR